MRKFGKALACMAVLGVCVSAFAARMMQDLAQRDRAGRAATATLAAAGATAGTRAQGAQPLIPGGTLLLTGDVVETAGDTGPLTVTVTVGKHSYAANVQGANYSVPVYGGADTDMVTAEVTGLRLHYRSVVGSLGRLRALAGNDRRLDLSEQPGLRLSPHATALTWLSAQARGGVEPSTDAEFELGMRAVHGDELINATYLVRGVAVGAIWMPDQVSDGYQYLTNRAQFNNYLMMDQWKMDAGNYFSQAPSAAGLKSLQELPDQLLLTDALNPELPMATTDVRLLQRQTGNEFEFLEKDARRNPRYTAALDASGDVILTPIGSQGYTLENSVQRQYQRFILRRHYRGAPYSQWSVRLEWVDVYVSGARFTGSAQYSLVGRDLANWKQPNTWSMGDALRALPWLCVDSSAAGLTECEYAQHQPAAAGPGHLVHHGAKFASDLTPLLSPDGPAFAQLTLDAQGGLHVVNDDSETVFWRVENPDRGFGTVVYLSRSRSMLAYEQSKVGLSFTVEQQAPQQAITNATGEWRDSRFKLLPARYADTPGTPVVLRQFDGTGEILDLPPGIAPALFHWSIENGVLYERGIYRALTPAEDCSVLLPRNGQCSTVATYFRPLYRQGHRYFGVEESYWLVNRMTTPDTFDRLASRPMVLECVAFDCLSDSGMPVASQQGIAAASRPQWPARFAASRRVPVKSRYLIQ